MAFNFNWSPLIADTSRARDLLTAALNKSPKPPIIVDDIVVNELNLGSVPPELEILEIGDLAEDRFRGIFKMSYTGDAFLTLKTRVQANPLNTYLSAKPSFASPQPLAAASGLTIPLQITLSDIRLSGFVILVFSRQKGLTLVFRNDPLESLKVSSTFDSIPFVRDYLQREIEGQLRNLFMEDLPAILHRLSLRLWVPEYCERDEDEAKELSNNDNEIPIDPLASPPQGPQGASGNSLDDNDISSLSLSASGETHASFSQKNLLRLAALSDSHRTLSLFTPSIRDTVFRAWSSTSDRGDFSGTSTPTLTASGLSRLQSTIGSTGSIFSPSEGSETGTASSRPSLVSFGSTYGTLGGAVGRSRAHGARKRKHRIINLRRSKTADDLSDSISAGSSTAPTSTAPSEANVPPAEEKEDELVTPPSSPDRKLQSQSRAEGIDDCNSPARTRPITPMRQSPEKQVEKTPVPENVAPKPSDKGENPSNRRTPPTHQLHHLRSFPTEYPSFASSSSLTGHPATPGLFMETSTGGILEQAWLMKMAAEIARKVQDEKAAGAGFWDRGTAEESPPPAYAV